MNVTEALAWLESHQPLPCDSDLSPEIANDYDEIRKYFLEHPDGRCIPLFLNSFGGENGWGLYQFIEDVLSCYSPDEVLPHLVTSLSSLNPHVRQWSAQIAAIFPDPCLIRPLAQLLADDDADIKAGAIIALQQIPDQRVASILEVYLENESDAELRELANT